MTVKRPLGPPSFGAGVWLVSRVSPGVWGHCTGLKGMKGCTSRVFLGGRGDDDPADLTGATEVDATSVLSPGATRTALGAAAGHSVPVCPCPPPPFPRPSLTPGAGGACHLPSRPAVPAEADGDGRRRSGRSRVSPCHEPAGAQPPGTALSRSPAMPAVAPAGAPLSLLPPAVTSHPTDPRLTAMDVWSAGVTWAVPKCGPSWEGKLRQGVGAGPGDHPPWVSFCGDTDGFQGCPPAPLGRSECSGSGVGTGRGSGDQAGPESPRDPARLAERGQWGSRGRSHLPASVSLPRRGGLAGGRGGALSWARSA